ncbi:DinB family protein [Gilvimarinus polysaccharolyticus]|uniref:DinB family protein n=1 Tax=Gilvimarinus polysaccharolyticus TaxID=863921 RepID=UPI000A052EED|nr:DinB family protein [Gilvimarinus polysaccharolyticus]
MDLHHHIRLMAGYNQRLNHQVFSAAARLDADALAADTGAFFGSIMGTLNHMVVTDLLWLARFAQHASSYKSLQALSELPTPERLDQQLYPTFAALGAARGLIDSVIIEWSVDELQSSDLQRSLTYHNSQGEASERDFGELVMHLFNHQTHHRGQASTLLNQRGLDIGVTDFLIDIPRLDEAS